MMPLSRTVQALVSSISNSAPAAGSRIDSGTKLAAVVAWREGVRRGPDGAAWRYLIDTLPPVVERRDADTSCRQNSATFRVVFRCRWNCARHQSIRDW